MRSFQTYLGLETVLSSRQYFERLEWSCIWSGVLRLRQRSLHAQNIHIFSGKLWQQSYFGARLAACCHLRSLAAKSINHSNLHYRQDKTLSIATYSSQGTSKRPCNNNISVPSLLVDCTGYCNWKTSRRPRIRYVHEYRTSCDDKSSKYSPGVGCASGEGRCQSSTLQRAMGTIMDDELWLSDMLRLYFGRRDRRVRI